MNLEQLSLLLSVGIPVLSGVLSFVAAFAGTRASLRALEGRVESVEGHADRAHDRIDALLHAKGGGR